MCRFRGTKCRAAFEYVAGVPLVVARCALFFSRIPCARSRRLVLLIKRFSGSFSVALVRLTVFIVKRKLYIVKRFFAIFYDL